MTKILLVDDEESIRNMMRMTLELDGFHVLMAETAPRHWMSLKENLLKSCCWM